MRRKNTWVSLQELPKTHQDAVTQTLAEWGQQPDPNTHYNVETHPTSEMIQVFKGWGWLEDVNTHEDVTNVVANGASGTDYGKPTHDPEEKERFAKILAEHQKGNGPWPYCSSSARDWRTLKNGSPEERHGDGYHRVMVAAYLRLPTVDVVFAKPGNT